MSETRRAADQGRVLADVRRALGRSATVSPPPLEPFLGPAAAAKPEELIARFTDEARAVGAQVYRVSSPAEAAALIAKVCADAGVSEAALSDAPLIAETELCAQLAARGLPSFRVTDYGPGAREELIARLERCGAGVSAVDYAIAETGTIALSSDEEGGLLVSLLPAVHIALIRSQQIAGSLAEVVERLNRERMDRAVPCRSATFITGPSRTSDVELVLSIGVHGPKELHLIILGAP
jgi:L-lactate dehydrogenase complex protein LldG